MKNLELKKLRPVFNSFKKNHRPALTMAMVKNGETYLNDLETRIIIKDNFNLHDGLYKAESIGLDKTSHDDLIDDYPVFTQLKESDFSFTIELKDLLDFTKYASKDETRIYLMGLAVDRGHLVACNGHILKFKDIDSPNDLSAIMPTTSIKKLIQIAKKFKLKEVKINLTEDYFWIDTDYFYLSGLLIKREYPKWPQVVPKKFANNFTLNDWIDLKELKPLFKNNMACGVTICDGMVNLFIDGHSTSYLIGTCPDTEIEKTIGFNAKYLDLLINKAMGLTIEFNNELSPVKIENKIVMPLKL